MFSGGIEMQHWEENELRQQSEVFPAASIFRNFFFVKDN